MKLKTYLVVGFIVIGFVLVMGCSQQATPTEPQSNLYNVKNSPSENGHYTLVWDSVLRSDDRLFLKKIRIPEDNVTCYVSGYSDGISCLRD